jgi:mRNA-degrading endonuclease HigB of HigAB toxin-antitoxin module
MLPFWDLFSPLMRLIGQMLLEDSMRLNPECAAALRAWRDEMRYRSWSSVAALAAAYIELDLSELPMASFRVGSPALRIRTLIDIHAGVVLITHVTQDLR